MRQTPISHSLRSTLILMATLACLWPSAVTAHDYEPERQLLVQVFPDRVDVLIAYTEAPGKRSDLFRAQFGLAAQGQASDLVDTLASRAFLPRMLDGLEFEVLGETPRTSEPELKLEESDGRLMAVAHVRYELPTLDEDQRRTFIVRARDRNVLPTQTIIYGGDELQILDEKSPRDALEFELTSGQSKRAVFGF